MTTGAPPFPREDYRHDVAMEQPWISETLRLQDRDYSGWLPPELVASNPGTPWARVIAKLVPRKLAQRSESEAARDSSSELLTQEQPDIVRLFREGRPHERFREPGPKVLPDVRSAWVSDSLAQGQADIVRWLRVRLADGRLRASGRKALPDAPYEWIPREQWERLAGIGQGNAWRHLFRRLNAFKLRDDEPAWCDVRVVVARLPDASAIAARLQSPPATDATTPRGKGGTTLADDMQPEPSHALPANTKGGRPKQYRVEEFEIEFARYMGEMPNSSKKEQNSHMIVWSSDNYSTPPGKQWVRDKARILRSKSN